MNNSDTVLAIELLVNHLTHLRSQVEILQERLGARGILVQDEIERELEESWANEGSKAVDAWWDQFKRLKSETT